MKLLAGKYYIGHLIIDTDPPNDDDEDDEDLLDEMDELSQAEWERDNFD